MVTLPAPSASRTVPRDCRGLRVALMLLLPGACAQPDAADQEVLLSDSAGVRTSLSAHPTTIIEFSGVPSLRIGTAGGDRNQELSRITDAVFLPDGTIVVANAGTDELRFFGPDGSHRLTVGRSGDGPGEFRKIESLVATADSLYVFDSSLLRVSVYDLEGSLHGVRSLQGTPADGHPLYWYRLLAITERGDFLLVPSAYPVQESTGRTVRWQTTPNRLYDRSGSFLGTVGEDSGVELAGPIPILFNRISASAFADDRLFITDGMTFEVRAYDLDGHLSAVVRLDRRPDPVTEEVRRAYTESIVAGQFSPGGGRALLEDAIITPFTPTIRDLFVDPSGNLWMGEFWEFWRPMEATRDWQVVDPEGRWLRTVRLPGNVRIFEIGAGYILGAIRDELGVEYIVQYPLARSN